MSVLWDNLQVIYIMVTLHPAEYYGNHYCKLMLTLTVIIGISVVFTVLEVSLLHLMVRNLV